VGARRHCFGKRPLDALIFQAFLADRALVAQVEAGTPIHAFVAAGILPAQLPAIT